MGATALLAVTLLNLVGAVERFAPVLPEQFDCKLKLDIGYDGVDRPLLLLLHVDLINNRVREDYYYLHVHPPKKYFTNIRLYEEGRQFMAFYRVKGDTLSSPKTCFIAPVSGSLPSRDFLRRDGTFLHSGHFTVSVGENGTVEVKSSDDDAESNSLGSEQRVFANVWGFEFDGKPGRLLESTRTRFPLQVKLVSFLPPSCAPVSLHCRVNLVVCVRTGKCERDFSVIQSQDFFTRWVRT